MAAVEVTITGMLYDKLARTTQNVVLIGDATLTGLGVGGGPLPGGPGQPPGGGGSPPGTWGGSGQPFPTPPIANVPGVPGYRPPGSIWPNPPEGSAPLPEHPIALPGDPWWPPDAPQAPQLPPPGSPPVIVPGTTPVHPINPPQAIVVDYPGIGKVLVPQPLPAG